MLGPSDLFSVQGRTALVTGGGRVAAETLLAAPTPIFGGET